MLSYTPNRALFSFQRSTTLRGGTVSRTWANSGTPRSGEETNESALPINKQFPGRPTYTLATYPQRSFCTPRVSSHIGSYLPPKGDSLPLLSCLSTSTGHQTSQKDEEHVWISKTRHRAQSPRGLTRE